jgi:hypothetical protein
VITQPTRHNIIVFNEIRCFFQILRLLSRHAITLWYITSYAVFSEYSDYSADTRNTIGRFDLWQIRNSDYSADTRKSIPDKEMWPSAFSSPWARACAPSHMVSPAPFRMPRQVQSLQTYARTRQRQGTQMALALRRGSRGDCGSGSRNGPVDSMRFTTSIDRKSEFRKWLGMFLRGAQG